MAAYSKSERRKFCRKKPSLRVETEYSLTRGVGDGHRLGLGTIVSKRSTVHRCFRRQDEPTNLLEGTSKIMLRQLLVWRKAVKTRFVDLKKRRTISTLLLANEIKYSSDASSTTMFNPLSKLLAGTVDYQYYLFIKKPAQYDVVVASKLNSNVLKIAIQTKDPTFKRKVTVSIIDVL